MRKSKCIKTHYPESICMAERIVLFHGTKFRVALTAHEFYCEKCKQEEMLARIIFHWILSKSFIKRISICWPIGNTGWHCRKCEF